MDAQAPRKSATEASLSQLIEALEYYSGLASVLAKEYKKRHFNGIREDALIYCLARAADISKGSLHTARQELPESLNILARSLLETLVWAKFVTLSKENAQAFKDSSLHELSRAARINLEERYARIVDKETGQDVSANFLRSMPMREIPRRLTIEAAAKKAGLAKLYTTTYRFLSLYAHGTAFGLSPPASPESDIFASVSAALGLTECLILIASDWIVRRQHTPEATIRRALGM